MKYAKINRRRIELKESLEIFHWTPDSNAKEPKSKITYPATRNFP